MELTAEEQRIKRGQEILNGSINARDMIELRWGDSNDLYDAKFSVHERKVSELLGVPRIFLPKTYIQLQRILTDILETFFFDFEEICNVKSWKSIPTVTLKIVKSLLNYRLTGHPINFYQETYELAIDAMKNKVGIFKIYPKIQTRKKGSDAYQVDETGARTEPTGKETADELIRTFTPVIECTPYEDVFFSAQATWKDYWRWPIVHRVKRTREYCRQRGYTNVDKVGTASMVSDDRVKQQRQNRQGSPFMPPSHTLEALEEIYVFEVWDFDVDAEKCLVSGSYVLGGDAKMPGVLLRDWKKNELPYRFDPCEPVRPPFIVASAYPEPHSMYGKDFPEFTEGMQKETNAAVNQEREAVARAIRPPTLVDRNADIDLMALMIRKIGGIVMGGNISETGIREMGVNSPIPISAPARQRIDQDYSEISSVSPNQLGAPTNPSQSATMFAGVDRNANKAISKVILNLAVTGIVPAMAYLCRLEQAYETDEFIELVTGRILGWKFRKNTDDSGKKSYSGPSPWATIQGDFDFTVNLGVNKQGQIGHWAQLLQFGMQTNATLAQMLQIGAAQAKDVKFFKPDFAFEQIASLLGQRNTEEMYFQSVQPPPAQPGAAGSKGTPSAPAAAAQPNGPGPTTGGPGG